MPRDLLPFTGVTRLRLHGATVLAAAYGDPFPDLAHSPAPERRRTSRIHHDDPARLIKICLVQSTPRNPLLRAIGLSRARVEERGNRALDALGLRTPRITAVAAVLNPISPVDSALIVERVADAREGIDYLRDEAVPDALRFEFIRQVVAGITRMHDADLILRDLRLSNILVRDDDPTPVWIDNEVKATRSRPATRSRMRITVARMLLKNGPAIPARFADALAAPLTRLIA